MAWEIEPLIRTGVARIQKVEWLEAFVAAYDKAVVAKNILGGFQRIGIHPFLLTKVVPCVTTSLEPQPRSSTPPNPLTVFNDVVLIESLSDFNAVQ